MQNIFSINALHFAISDVKIRDITLYYYIQ